MIISLGIAQCQVAHVSSPFNFLGLWIDFQSMVEVRDGSMSVEQEEKISLLMFVILP